MIGDPPRYQSPIRNSKSGGGEEPKEKIQAIRCCFAHAFSGSERVAKMTPDLTEVFP